MAEAETRNPNEPADFETAIAECGFGLFNIIILLCATPCLAAMVFSSSSVSYILPLAVCDLELSLLERGMLNAATFAGMILSAVPWGFIADTMGRRLVLICGGWIDGFLMLGAAFSQDSVTLMIFKFFDGFVICGPFAVIVSYLAEFHGKKHRTYIMIYVGLAITMASLLLTIMAYYLVPLQFSFNIGSFKFSNWHMYLAVCAVPSLMSGFLHMFLPESPKFLMAQGNYNKAMQSFKRIYKLNKRKDADSYPIKELTDATPDLSPDPNRSDSLAARCTRAKAKLIGGFKQLKPMFSSPYLALSLQVFFLHFCQLMCVNSLRLWLPQIFATMRQFDMQGMNDTSICAILEHNAPNKPVDKKTLESQCELVASAALYMDNIIVASVGLLFFILVFPLLRIEKIANHLLKVCLFIDTFILAGFYFAKSPLAILTLSTLYLTIMGISATIVIGMSIAVFPTLMRTMVVLLTMTFGRLGSVTGNLLLPVFIQINCVAPFIWLCTLMTIAFINSLFLRLDSQQELK